MSMKLRIAAALLASALTLPANAAPVIFNGSASANGVVSPDPSCAPLFRGVATAAPLSGTSSLGAFTYNHLVCTQAGTGPLFGTFSIVFAGDQFDGTLSGISTAVGDGTFTQQISYFITGGTGRFVGGTGAFQSNGAVDPRVRPSQLSLNFTAVPEPTTWAMMIGGFGMVGAGMRRRRGATIAAAALT